MQNLNEEMKSLKSSHSEYIHQLNEVSNCIKELEASLIANELFYEYKFEAERSQFDEYDYKSWELQWKKSEHGKWRIYSVFIKFNCGDLSYSEKPFGEEPAELRIEKVCHLKNFTRSMQNYFSKQSNKAQLGLLEARNESGMPF